MAARSFFYGGGDTGAGGDSAVQKDKRVLSSSSSFNQVDSFFVPRSSSTFQGSRSMVSFEDRGNRSGGQFFQSFDHEDNGDDEYDDYFHQPEKKRRLTVDQVLFLEKSFEIDNKLEPDRKIQLAKDTGLQPRQVAIWFQNRRARWKNKRLEKDYDDLQENYNKLKANYENLVTEKEKLKSEVNELSDKLMLQEKGTSDSSSTKNLSQPQLSKQNLDHGCEEVVSKDMNSNVEKSVEFDNGGLTSLLERVDSSYVFDREQSEGSLNEENNFNKMFLPLLDNYYNTPKIENDEYTDSHSMNSCYLGLPGDDQAFGFWSY